MQRTPEEGTPRQSTDTGHGNGTQGDEATLLGSFDVFSLIVNKMIGTGIYTAPTTVLLLTGSPQLSLGLWAVGFIYTIMSMIIYLDYAAVFPYTGGEIIYIDEITSANNPPPPPTTLGSVPDAQHINGGFRHRRHSDEIAPNEIPLPAPPRGIFSRILGDGLLPYTCYAALFIGVFNSGTNIMQIGRETLIAISPDRDPNGNWVRFISIFVLFVICAIQLASSRAGRVLNKALAVIKIAFLISLFGFGCDYIRRNGTQAHFTEKIQGITSFNYAQALLVVLYSYDGWENATFVAGEISRKDPGTLRKGFIWAVAVVGIVYMMLNVVFLCAIPYETLAALRDNKQQYSYAALFSNNIPSAQRGWAIVIAISSTGNANTVIYTFTRVKQSIGHMNILPWSKFWKSDFNPHRNGNGDLHKTPLGGLALELIMSIVIVAISAAIPGEIESVNLPGNIQTIAHCFILITLGLGLFRLHSRQVNLNITVTESWFPRVSEWGATSLSRVLQIFFILTYAGMNSFIFVATGKSKTDGVDVGYSFDGKWYLTIVLSVVGLGMIYYFVVFAAYVPSPLYKQSLLKVANVTCDISKQPNFEQEEERVRRFGQRRVITISLNDLNPKWKAAIFWFFGGKLDDSPLTGINKRWKKMKQNLLNVAETIKGAFTSNTNASQRSVGSDDGVAGGHGSDNNVTHQMEMDDMAISANSRVYGEGAGQELR